MGRYSSLQSFSDTNQEVAPTPYEKASGGSATASEGAGGAVRVPVVHNVKGSAAGVGSGYFHTYRLQRRKEMERLKEMDEKHGTLTADQEHLARLELNKLEAEERTLKRAAKRHKRKEKERNKRRRGHADTDVASALAGEHSENDDSADEVDDEEGGEDAAKLHQAAIEAAADVEEDELLKNDGKFLERFLAKPSPHGTAESEPAPAAKNDPTPSVNNAPSGHAGTV